MRFFKAIILLLAAYTPLVVAAGCVQETGFSLTPSLPPIANNTGGMLSTSWHTADLQVGCSALGSSYYVSNNITPAGIDSGRTQLFEGVYYRLYTTSERDVFYFGGVAGPDGILRPFGTSYAHGLTIPASNDFKFRATVKIRFFSTSKSMTPGVYTVNSAGLVKGNIRSNGATENLAESGMNLSAFSFLVNGPSCTLAMPAELKLKSVDLSLIPTPGDSNEAANFQLGLNCAGSTPAYQVSYSMSDVNDLANQSSTLTLADAAKKASGVSLQVVDGMTPVNFGSTSKRLFGSMPNGGGMISKSMSVRYIRTSTMARPGSVRAGVTVTLSYK
ncbi:fimbrial protein [Pseudomonas sp. PA-1-2A]|uniref:fimbrial protein n=1 Tax=Pseudomonas TaxID=286 RepID=UPI001EEF9A9F|nr:MULTISPECIES: fimbrial protein [Pseudomonas]MCF5692533.1 fimbrial protein [Pseudomonas sp. PA-1-8C]MCF5786087.1 fimbrial protein [Pseudomonas sp. PA-1-6G]MCF5791756.1 fimbrial protein [Pseudomonas sp. PA-1-6B]MCF5797470.1 fimbrial protein [Pseudomonas sp. PA-1-5A]MCF5814601.1 fimbrial protein [Pseudomonas sp. PA-1-2A]